MSGRGLSDNNNILAFQFSFNQRWTAAKLVSQDQYFEQNNCIPCILFAILVDFHLKFFELVQLFPYSSLEEKKIVHFKSLFLRELAGSRR